MWLSVENCEIRENLFGKILSVPKNFIGILGALLLTAVSSFLVVMGSFLFPRKRSWADWVIEIWSKGILCFFNIRVELAGKENIPEGSCLYLINHVSHFDIPIFHGAVTPKARFGAKAELFKIPLFGRAMERSGAMKIHRGRREQVFRLYEKMVTSVNERGRSFVLAAEGTRMTEPGVGREFKSGPLFFALAGQFPIVPVVIKGAYEVLPKSRWLPFFRWSYPVRVQVLDPVPTQGLGFDDRHELKERLRTLMTKAYQEL